MFGRSQLQANWHDLVCIHCTSLPIILLTPPLYLYLPETLGVTLSCLPLISKNFLKYLYHFIKYFDIIIFYDYREVFFHTIIFLYVNIQMFTHFKNVLYSPSLTYFSLIPCLDSYLSHIFLPRAIRFWTRPTASPAPSTTTEDKHVDHEVGLSLMNCIFLPTS